jgi:SLOG cluster3 family
MSELFLSASVPIFGRGNFYETADPFLIQCAVRELVLAVIKEQQIVWGGHPAITPMIWAICKDLNVDYSNSVILYQSRFFKDMFPEENKYFNNVIYVDAVQENRDASLLAMREAMLSRDNLKAAVFIGGMEGVEAEYELFKKFHPNDKILLVPSPGGAALQLAKSFGELNDDDLSDIDFAKLFHTELRLNLANNK